jgi:hypothetical protein
MSHSGNDKIREQIANDIQEMSHRDKVMTLLGFFYDSDMWITADFDELSLVRPTKFHQSHGDGTSREGKVDAQKRLDNLDRLLIEVLFDTHE